MTVSPNTLRTIIDLFSTDFKRAQELCLEYKHEFTASQAEDIKKARDLVESNLSKPLQPLYHR